MGNSNGTNSLESESAASQSEADLPQHVAIIMDGNGRWAQERGLPRLEGHRRGEKAAKAAIEEARRLGIKYLTLFAFSTENWKRPPREVTALMGMFARVLDKEVSRLSENNIKLRIIGNREDLDPKIQKLILSAEEKTKDCDGMTLCVALSYGGRGEIANAAKQIARKAAAGELDPETVNQETLAAHLYTPDIPDPDVLIRTSGEARISNFLLWQCAYSEICISPVFWPDFNEEEFQRCLQEFSGRSRRFGMTDQQVQDQVQAV